MFKKFILIWPMLLIMFLPFIFCAEEMLDRFEKANSYVKEKKFDQAIAEYKEALKIYPDNGLVHLQLGLIYANRQEHSLAVKHLLEAVKIKPDSSRAHYYLGLVYSQQKDYKNAALYFRKTIELEPKSFLAYYNLGLISSEKKDYAKAVDEFNKCLKINPAYAKACVGLGGAYYNSGQKNLAYKQVRKLRELGENDMANALSNWIENQK